MVVSALVIIAMITLTIKTNFTTEEYPSGLIEDQQANLANTNADFTLGLDINDMAPNFELQTIEGEKVQLSDFRGKKVFLNFWASWCGPCKVEMPHMQNYYDAYQDLENVEILAVNMTTQERNRELVQKFIDANTLTFPIVLDTEGEVEKLYKVIGYPTTYLINEEGIIVDGFTASVDEKKIKTLIDQMD